MEISTYTFRALLTISTDASTSTTEQVIASLLLRLHFALPTEPDAQGHVKEIQWKLGVSHIPVVKLPAGDGVTPQVPLSVRLVREEDFVW
jgi:hypothetical protein